MKRWTFLIFLGIYTSLSATNIKDSIPPLDTIPLYPLTKHKSYASGEEFNFSLKYGFITGGSCRLTVKDTVINNVKVLHIDGSGRTVGLAEALYRVRDRYESFIDPKTDMPVKAIRSIREGRYKYYNEVTYNRDSATVFSKKSGVHHVQDGILDILSAFYFARNHKFNDKLKEGEIIEFMTYFSDNNYPLRIRFKGYETLKTEFGNVECYVFSPVTEVGRSFKTEDDMRVWISRDKNRIPLKIQFNIVVGSFNCELESFKGLKHPFSSIKR